MSTRPGRVASSVVATLMQVQALVLHLIGWVYLQLRRDPPVSRPWPVTVPLAVIAEIATGLLVHDNLTLNILNFIHRFPAVEAWQRRA